MISVEEMILRLVVGAVLGGLVGLERLDYPIYRQASIIKDDLRC